VTTTDAFLPSLPLPGASPVLDKASLQDYQMQLMLLERQNKKKLLMARQEHDTLQPLHTPSLGSPPPTSAATPEPSASIVSQSRPPDSSLAPGIHVGTSSPLSRTKQLTPYSRTFTHEFTLTSKRILGCSVATIQDALRCRLRRSIC